MQRESSSSQNRKAGHTHTLTHRMTAIPSLLACGGEGNYSPAAARVMTTKVLSPRPRINAARQLAQLYCKYITFSC